MCLCKLSLPVQQKRLLKLATLTGKDFSVFLMNNKKQTKCGKAVQLKKLLFINPTQITRFLLLIISNYNR